MSLFSTNYLFDLDETPISKEINNKKFKTKMIAVSNTIPWVDKYRPKKTEEIISQDHVIKVLEKSVKTGDFPNLLFYGPPGTGKTSTILVIAMKLFGQKMFDDRVIELNASDERGISVVREKIKDYARMSIASDVKNKNIPNFKLIILDEADSMTPKAQFALRKIIEDYSNTTRFCFICNYINRIILPIKSRCEKIRFNPVKTEPMGIKLKEIANNEKVNIDNKSINTIIDVSNGDMRQAIMLLWNLNFISKFKGKITPEIVNETADIIPNDIMNELWNFCLLNVKDKKTTKIINVAKKIKSLGYPINTLINQLNKKVIYDNMIDDEKKSLICMHLASTHKILNHGADEYIQLLNTLTFIKSIIVGKDHEPIEAL